MKLYFQRWTDPANWPLRTGNKWRIRFLHRRIRIYESGRSSCSRSACKWPSFCWTRPAARVAISRRPHGSISTGGRCRYTSTGQSRQPCVHNFEFEFRAVSWNRIYSLLAENSYGFLPKNKRQCYFYRNRLDQIVILIKIILYRISSMSWRVSYLKLVNPHDDQLRHWLLSVKQAVSVTMIGSIYSRPLRTALDVPFGAPGLGRKSVSVGVFLVDFYEVTSHHREYNKKDLSRRWF